MSGMSKAVDFKYWYVLNVTMLKTVIARTLHIIEFKEMKPVLYYNYLCSL